MVNVALFHITAQMQTTACTKNLKSQGKLTQKQTKMENTIEVFLVV